MISHALLLIAALGLTQAPSDDPLIFAPGAISGGASDAALTLSPDGHVAFFERSNRRIYAIMESHLTGKRWSKPKIAPFSGHWLDLESAIAADGSYLVFASNRPAEPGGKPIDGSYYGKVQIAKGGALWRVDRVGRGWGEPYRLPGTVNISSSIYEPSLAANGDIYFQSADADGKAFHLYVARARAQGFARAERIDLHGPDGSSDMDPAIARDESFLIFSSDRGSASDHHLFIAFRVTGGWSEPRALGANVNSGSVGDPRLDEAHNRLYFASGRLAAPSGDTQRDLDAAGEWNNGLSNIWFVPFDASSWKE